MLSKFSGLSLLHRDAASSREGCVEIFWTEPMCERQANPRRDLFFMLSVVETTCQLSGARHPD